MTKQPSATLWPVVFMAIAAGVIVAMHLGKVAPALPAIRAELGGDLVTTGWIASVVSLVGALGGLVLGTVANNADTRRMAIAALLLLSVASLAGSIANTPLQLIVARSFEGLAIITMAVSAPAIIGRTTTSQDRSFGLALWSTYVPTGMTLGILLAVIVLAISDWRTLWLVVGVLTFIFSCLFGFTTRRLDLGTRQSTTIASAVASVTTVGPWLLGACFACYAFMWVTLITWMPSFLSSELDMGLSSAALATALMTGVNVIGNFAGAFWLRRDRSRLALISVALLTMAVCGWFSLSEGSNASYRVLFGIMFSLVSGVIPAALIGASSIMARRPEDVASANGVVVQGSQLGQLTGPPVAGALAQSAGSFAATAVIFPVASVIGLGFGLAIARLEKGRRQQRHET